VGLAYERHGSGPPLLLLHGVGHRRQAWLAVLDRLTPHRDVVLVDLPGHGESPPLNLAGRPVLDALLAEVTGLLDELALERPHVAGNSLGGRLALEAAVAGRAATVTALSPAGFWRGRSELLYAGAVFKIMEFAGARTRRLAPAMSRTTAGRALLYGAIVSRPSRISPEQALGDTAAFVAAKEAMDMVGVAARLRARADDRRSRAGGRRPAARQRLEVSRRSCRLAPVDRGLGRLVGVAFQPAVCERAQRHDGQALPRCAVDCGRHQPAADATPLQFSGNLGVDEDEPVPVAAVLEFGEEAADPELEAGLRLIVGDLRGIAHACHRRIRRGSGFRRLLLLNLASHRRRPSRSWLVIFRAVRGIDRGSQ
jgi:pimeloyl-ACP methyl ester carboxylesterase